jgi:hypothetical protein
MCDAAGRTDHKRLPATEQQGQALLFHGGMETADNRDASVAERSGQIVRLHNDMSVTKIRGTQ